MKKRIVIPLYTAEQEFFEEKLKNNRDIAAATAFYLIQSGIKHWKAEVSFDEYISVITYPTSCKIDDIAIWLDEDSEEYKIIDELHKKQKLPRTKVARFFMLYDWRYKK